MVTLKFLAVGAQVRAAAGDTGFDDGGAAARAWLALAPEHVCERQVLTALTFGVHVVLVSRTAFGNTELQNVAQRFV